MRSYMKYLSLTVIFFLFCGVSAFAGYYENVKRGRHTTRHASGGEPHNLTGSSHNIAAKHMLGGPDSIPDFLTHYGDKIIETGDLQAIYWDGYKRVAHEIGSKLHVHNAVFRPRNIPKGWFMLGDTIDNYYNHGGPDFPTLLVRQNSNVKINGKSLLVPPKKFVRQYSIWGGNRMHHQQNFWRAVPPDDSYVCLGLVGSNDPYGHGNAHYKRYGKKVLRELKSKYRCVHKDLLVNGILGSRTKQVRMFEKNKTDDGHMGSTPPHFKVYMNIAGRSFDPPGEVNSPHYNYLVEQEKQGDRRQIQTFNSLYKDILLSNVMKNIGALHYYELRTDTPGQISQQLKRNYSGEMIRGFADNMSRAVAKAAEESHAPSASDAASREIDSAKKRPGYNAYLDSYNSAPRPQQEDLASGDSSSPKQNDQVKKDKDYQLSDLLREFGLDKVNYSSPRFKHGTVQTDKGGDPETYSIARVTLNNVKLPPKLIRYIKTNDRFNLGMFIDANKRYSGDIMLLARNYSGEGPALAAVLPVDVKTLNDDSKLFQSYRKIAKLPSASQPAAVVLGVVSWAAQIEKKNIPGLGADFIWKLKEIPEEFRGYFQKIAGTKANDSFNPAFVFHHGASALLGVDLNAMKELQNVNKILAGKPPHLVFSLLPRGSAMDNYDLKMVAMPDYKIDRSALFSGINKNLDIFTFSEPRLELESTFTTPVKILGSVKSWFTFNLKKGQQLKAYSVISVPLAANIDSGIEFAAFIDDTIKHPFGLNDQNKFPDMRLVNPQMGGKLGISGWVVWMGGKPLFSGKPVENISFVRGGVIPVPPFVSFVDLELEKSSLTQLSGPLGRGTVASLGTTIDFKPFPTDMLKLGSFTWEDQKVSEGPRLIYSDVTLDTIGITKGVTAMGSLIFDAGDSHQEIELGKFEFVHQGTDTIAGRGSTKALHLGELEFVGKRSNDPLLDVYLTLDRQHLAATKYADNHILFEGAFKLFGERSAAYIRINTKEDVAVSLSNKSLGLGEIELTGKGSMLSLIDKTTGSELTFRGTVKDPRFIKTLKKETESAARNIPIVKEAIALAGGHLFDLESITVESTPALLSKGQMGNVKLKASAFGHSFTVELKQPVACNRISGILQGKAKNKIKEIAKDLVPDPLQFLEDLAENAKERGKEELAHFETLAGSRSPEEFVNNAADVVNAHADDAKKAAAEAASVAQDTAKTASKAAEKVSEAVTKAINDFLNALDSLKFW